MSGAGKGLLRDSAVFALASVVQKCVPFVLVPVITAHLGKEAFKVYDVALLYALLFSWLGVLGQDVAASVHYFDAEKSEVQRTRVLSSGLYIQAAATAVVLAVLALLHRPLGAAMFGGDAATAHGWTLALWGLPGAVVVNYTLNILRWVGRSGAYMALCSIQVAGALLPALYLVFARGQGLDAILWSHVGGSTAAGVAGLWLVRREAGENDAWLHPTWSVLRPMISYGVVFGGAAFFFGLLPALDRSFLLRFGMEDVLPEYALAAKIGAIPALLITAVGLAVSTYAFRTWHRAGAAAEMHNLARVVLVLFLALVPVALVGKDWLVELFADSREYSRTAALLPFFLYGWVADGALYFAMLGMYKSKRALPPFIVLAASTGVAALLNVLLIPMLGATGAALAFALAKCMQVALSWWWSNRYWHIRLPVGLLLAALIVSLALSWSSYHLHTSVYILVVLLSIGFAAAWMKLTGMLDVLLSIRRTEDDEASRDELVAATEATSLHHDV